MTPFVLVTLVTLSVVGLAPMFLIVGRRLTAVALAPLGGALLAAWAAEGELLIGGTFPLWFVGLGIASNAVCAAYVLGARRSSPLKPGQIRLVPERRWVSKRTSPPSRSHRPYAFKVLPSLCLAAACGAPLALLSAKYVTHDANAIWIFHATWILAGHRQYRANLLNPAYSFSNPSYPPLVSAAIATSGLLRFALSAPAAAALVAVLNSCALFVAASGLVHVRSAHRGIQGAVAVLVAGGLCLQGFTLDAPYSLGGDADLLWAACATAALMYGLVLPCRRDYFATATLCCLIASFTKTEGLVTALMVAALMALRYLRVFSSCAAGPLWDRMRRSLRARARSQPAHWGAVSGRVAIGGLVALGSGAVWFLGLHAMHVENRFFSASTLRESSGLRLHFIGIALLPYLPLLGLAMSVEEVGGVRWRHARQAAGLGSPWLLWAVTTGYLGALVFTYAVGSLGIRGWLAASLPRTMVFTQLALFSEMGTWCILGSGSAADGLRRVWPTALRRPGLRAVRSKGRNRAGPGA